jgi:hypothetical protein
VLEQVDGQGEDDCGVLLGTDVVQGLKNLVRDDSRHLMLLYTHITFIII